MAAEQTINVEGMLFLKAFVRFAFNNIKSSTFSIEIIIIAQNFASVSLYNLSIFHQHIFTNISCILLAHSFWRNELIELSFYERKIYFFQVLF